MFIAFLIFLFLGMPVAFAMSIAGIAALLQLEGVSLLLVPQRIYLSLNSFPLLAVPFFILAGEVMNRGGITKRILGFADALVGHFRGGFGHVNVVSNMLMAGISGSASADAVAIGSVMIPSMVRAGFSPGFAAGVTASAACIGPIIPPSIVMVIYGAITGVSIGAMFMGGIVPGILIGLSLMFVVRIYAQREGWTPRPRVPLRIVLSRFLDAIWAILAPLIIVGGILTGVFTPTEAGVVACVYSFLVGLFIYKEIKVGEIKNVLAHSAMATASPMIIVGGAAIFGWILARQQFANLVSTSILSISDNPLTVFFIIIAMLFVIGMVVEGLAAMLIFVPVLFPIGSTMGFDPIHFALAIIIVTLIGTVTPPVGLQLYIACSIARISITKAVVWPFVAAMILVLLAIILFPPLVTFIPSITSVK